MNARLKRTRYISCYHLFSLLTHISSLSKCRISKPNSRLVVWITGTKSRFHLRCICTFDGVLRGHCSNGVFSTSFQLPKLSLRNPTILLLLFNALTYYSEFTLNSEHCQYILGNFSVFMQKICFHLIKEIRNGGKNAAV